MTYAEYDEAMRAELTRLRSELAAAKAESADFRDALESALRCFELLETRFCKIPCDFPDDSWGRTFRRRLEEWFRLFQAMMPRDARQALDRHQQEGS